MSRWKYKTAEVTVGENTQKVRGLTVGERKKFAIASMEIKAGNRPATDLPGMIVGFGCIDPSLTKEDVEAMPSDLLDAAVSKIMSLTGFKDEEKKDLASDDALPTFPALDQPPPPLSS